MISMHLSFTAAVSIASSTVIVVTVVSSQVIHRHVFDVRFVSRDSQSIPTIELPGDCVNDNRLNVFNNDIYFNTLKDLGTCTRDRLYIIRTLWNTLTSLPLCRPWFPMCLRQNYCANNEN